MGKSKRTMAKVKKDLSPEELENVRLAKITKLKALQARREHNKYTNLLKGAETRLRLAEDFKTKSVRQVEEALRGHKEAEAYLNRVAEEVVAWESHGVLVETTFSDLEVGDTVIVAHEENELGVKVVTEQVDPELVYGTVLTAGSKGTKVKIQKLGFAEVNVSEVSEANANANANAASELDTILTDDWGGEAEAVVSEAADAVVESESEAVVSEASVSEAAPAGD